MIAATRRSATGPVLAAIVFVVLMNAFLAFGAIRDLLQSEVWLSHTWQVISQLETIMNSAKDAETGVRGYVITGDAKYLKPFLDARVNVLLQIDQLASLTSDNPNQKVNVDELRATVTERLKQLDGGIATRRDQGFEAARDRVLKGDGIMQMNHLRAVASRAQAEERHMLVLREEAERKSGRRAYFTTAIAAALDLLFILAIFRTLARERKLRFASEDYASQLSAANSQIERTSAELQTLNAELEERVRKRTAEIETTNRELEAFSYSVSHDLRAPLRTIDGFSLALEEDYVDAVDETGRDYIKRVRAGVQRMGGLIDALLQLSRITRSEVNRTEVDVTALVESVAGNLRDENPDQVLHFTISEGMHADADPALLRVAFENLIGNAVKFSSRKPESRISVRFDEAKQAFLIEDNGAGFDMHYSEKLFNAFNRLHGDKDFKGSGIGLATVARVIRCHHGNIWADSQVGHGACFWFTLG